jgi:hypothetical protein
LFIVQCSMFNVHLSLKDALRGALIKCPPKALLQ